MSPIAGRCNPLKHRCNGFGNRPSISSRFPGILVVARSGTKLALTANTHFERNIHKTGRITVRSRCLRRIAGSVAVLTILAGALFTAVFAAEVSPLTARIVAENYLAHHVHLHGEWGGSPTPEITDSETIRYQDMLIAFNFRVHPAGHLLVSGWDEFSPVVLHSTRTEFDPERIHLPGAVESWVIPEMHQAYMDIASKRSAVEAATPYAESRVAQAWAVFGDTTKRLSTGIMPAGYTFATTGPLLSTQWNQSSPYNQDCPVIPGQCTTYVGCVALAFAQLMKYWNWPDRGVGSKTYYWSAGGENLSADFDHEYYWDRMPNVLSAGSTSAQKDAVARLCSDAGIAAEMQYGCSGSGSYMWADQVLGTYFKYKNTMLRRYRSNFTASQWLALFKQEFEALPGRPVILSIWTTSGGGHETVADGYQTGVTDKIHINMGWGGWYDGWYDITHNFTAAYEWSATQQVIVIGIEPDRPAQNPPVADFTADRVSGAKPLYVQFTSTVSGGAVDTYLWNFGDGGASLEANPGYTYTQEGAYTVSLSVSGSSGSDQKIRTNYITVGARKAGAMPISILQFLLNED